MERDESQGFIEDNALERLKTYSQGNLLAPEAEKHYPGFLSSLTCALLCQVALLFGGLACYTLGPLLIGWSAVLQVPDAARFVSIVPPPIRSPGPQDWYGVKLGNQPGTRILYVVSVLDKSLGHSKGVLPGDMVARAWQEDRLIWPSDAKDSIGALEDLQELKCFLETLPTSPPSKSPPCVLRKIDASQPLSVNFDMAHVVASNSKPPYFSISITCVKSSLGASILSIISALHNKDNLKLIFNLKTIRLLMIPTTLMVLGEVFEILAAGNMNPALFTVLSQSRILATAIFMRFWLGTKQTFLQSLILISISIVIFCYVQIPDYVGAGKYWNGFGDAQDIVEDGAAGATEVKQGGLSIGMVYAILRICIAVIVGVVCQKRWADPHIKSFSIITMQASIFVVALISLVPLTLFLLWAQDWKHGFFGGVAVEFRHCVKDWPQEMCLSTAPVAHLEQGWDYRTLIVALFYIVHNTTVNGVLKVFDALIRTLVFASATFSTYFLSLVVFGTKFNLTKCGLILGVILLFGQYAIAPKYVGPAAIQAESQDVELVTG